jgi:hypothetical protein
MWFGRAALRADIERWIQQILHSTFGHSTFGYVQDDEYAINTPARDYVPLLRQDTRSMSPLGRSRIHASGLWSIVAKRERMRQSAIGWSLGDAVNQELPQELPLDQADWQYGGKSSVRERLMSSSGWIGFRRK